MTLFNYDIFVNSLDELQEGAELELQVRDLTPGIHKYAYKWVKARVSAKADTYPQKLLIRFGRGQAYERPYSIEVYGEINKFPAKYL